MTIDKKKEEANRRVIPDWDFGSVIHHITFMNARFLTANLLRKRGESTEKKRVRVSDQ